MNSTTIKQRKHFVYLCAQCGALSKSTYNNKAGANLKTNSNAQTVLRHTAREHPPLSNLNIALTMLASAATSPSPSSMAGTYARMPRRRLIGEYAGEENANSCVLVSMVCVYQA